MKLVSYLSLFTAISLSIIAAYYSIVGLTSIFTGAFWPIVIMGVALELGKIVTTTWLFHYWTDSPKPVRFYLSFATIMLMCITSLGIFGFLSKAHIEQTVNHPENIEQVIFIEQQIDAEKERIQNNKDVLSQLDESVNVLLKNERIRGQDGALAVRNSQKNERTELLKDIEQSANKISDYRLKVNELQKDQRKIDAEIGPLKYISEIIYGENRTEDAVRFIIIFLVLVFDPLAIVLLLAANHSLKKNVAEKDKYDGIFISRDSLTSK
jgi:hypothetical protein